MNKAAAPLVMSSGQRQSLTLLARSSTAAHREVKRARVLLMAADGVANSKIAATVGVTPVTVRSWRGRFADEGLSKFGHVREGRGRKPGISAANLEEIVRLTQHEKPSGETHWSCRSMGQGGRGQSGHGSADLVRARPQAAPGQDVQTLGRPGL